MATKNVSALQRARAQSAKRLESRFKRLEDADDTLELAGEDLTKAVTEFFGEDAAKLQQQVMSTSAASEVGPAGAAATVTTTTASDDGISTQVTTSAVANHADAKQLMSALTEKMHKEAFEPMRGLLKKRGGGSRITTWHWRFCVLHPHAIAIHEGTDRPKQIRSVVPLKHIVQVCSATADESGDRPYAFAVHTSVGRSWVFCCMSQMDYDSWLNRLKTACALTHGAGLQRILGGR